MICTMPFGTRQKIGPLPAPLAPFKHTLTRTVGNTDRANGAPFAKAGRQPYQTFDFSWTKPYAELAPVLDALALSDGPPYYFLDPAALENPGEFNALPPQWAAPGLFSRGDPTAYLNGTCALVSPRLADLSTSQVTRSVASAWGAPASGVSYTFIDSPVSPPANVGKYDGGASPYQLASSPGPLGDVYNYSNPSATLLIPPGYVVGLWVSGEFTGAGIQFATASSATGDLSGVLRTGATVKVPTADEQAFYLGNGNDWTMVDVGFRASSGVGPHSMVLYGMSAYYFELGSVTKSTPGTFTRLWSTGRGQMPLWLGSAGAEINTYQSFQPERTSLSLNLTEAYIPW